MNTEIISFDKFLNIKDLYSMFTRFENNLLFEIDLNNSEYDNQSKANSINLIMYLGFLSKDKNGRYIKNINLNYEDFKAELLKRILNKFEHIISEIFRVRYFYDENNNSYYFYRNYIDLQYSGLIMLLEELGYLKSLGSSKLSFNDIGTNEHYKISRQLTLKELKDKIDLQNQYGEEAENNAKRFEDYLLKKKGINKECKIISSIDVSAGYDIVSYLNDSDFYNKFIEVKSCDNELNFYLSDNEIKTAKEKGDSYFLYLFNRDTKNFTIVANPYKEIFVNKNWIYKPTNFYIQKN